MPAIPTELEVAETEEHARSMTDEEILFSFTGLLSACPESWRSPTMMAAATPRSAMLTRVLWAEIANRWVPPEKFVQAVAPLLVEDDDVGNEVAIEAAKEMLRREVNRVRALNRPLAVIAGDEAS